MLWQAPYLSSLLASLEPSRKVHTCTYIHTHVQPPLSGHIKTVLCTSKHFASPYLKSPETGADINSPKILISHGELDSQPFPPPFSFTCHSISSELLTHPYDPKSACQTAHQPPSGTESQPSSLPLQLTGMYLHCPEPDIRVREALNQSPCQSSEHTTFHTDGHARHPMVPATVLTS